MAFKVSLQNITIRHELKAGDIGYVIYMHGHFYGKEQGFGILFETYVARGLYEFYQHYNPERERAWICEHEERIIGFLLLIDRGEAAQLRYFVIHPNYRGIGLGKKLMELFMEFLKEKKYASCYLMTTKGLVAAAALYTRYGFQLTEEIPSTAFGKPLTEQKYVLNLEP
ncbi:GNAT family N-acetyltransferase [Chryseolinea lacunae]|uniref:GNAT family N-acetyltransferase n=1 Tax=Chryseolinea lacunae TaxID=2801331 RepID=A0ABS1KZZ1_9BACT|nr:GNAT family N-acetyltransferase [Chryseolinea lacunae]MBL0744999.1 GNAT family N-acetyltransferase [Chryseolinea lacunae]